MNKIALYLSAFLTTSCGDDWFDNHDTQRKCRNDNECCSFGPAFLCQQSQCTYNAFVASDPVVFQSRQSMCGSTPGNNTGDETMCNGDPEQFGTNILADEMIARDVCQQPFSQEESACQSMTSGVASLPMTYAWDALIYDLRVQAGISSNVPIFVTPDIQSQTQFGGGMTGHSVVYVDGKFLDILAEYSNFVALYESGETTVSPISAIDTIVANHNSVVGQSAPQFSFPRSLLSDNSASNADAILRDFAGSILYHEFGHYWAWACVDMIRAKWSFSASIYFYPSKVEDDADLIAGILSAKAGHALHRAQEMIDVMAFYVMHRMGRVQSYQQILNSYEIQFVQLTSNYQSLMGRKQLIQRGYEDFQKWGNL